MTRRDLRALMRRLMRMNSQNQAEQITLLNEMNQLDPQTRASARRCRANRRSLRRRAVAPRCGRMTPENRKVYGMMLLGALNYTYVWYDPAGPIAPETYADMTVDAFIAGFGNPPAARGEGRGHPGGGKKRAAREASDEKRDRVERLVVVDEHHLLVGEAQFAPPAA